MKRYLSRISISLMTLGLVGFTALTALAVPRPFHLVEHGTATLSQKVGDHTIFLAADGTGNATHLGRFTLQRTATLTPTSDEGVFDVVGQATLIASNGDQLFASIKGTLNRKTLQAFLTYEWNGGTGRFQNASGETTWLVELHPDLTYDVVANGVIDY
jgi:hypothetical protein